MYKLLKFFFFFYFCLTVADTFIWTLLPMQEVLQKPRNHGCQISDHTCFLLFLQWIIDLWTILWSLSITNSVFTTTVSLKPIGLWWQVYKKIKIRPSFFKFCFYILKPNLTKCKYVCLEIFFILELGIRNSLN